MSDTQPDGNAQLLTLERDRKNLSIIDRALESGRINDEAGEYLKRLYSDSMHWFREVFYVLGKCFGAPKAAVVKYNYENNSAIDEQIRISDINPLSPYVVNHRLDADPMRNQFFTSAVGQRVDLAVSSIVTVIVGAQKNINRALDKITGKYYTDYVNDVADAAYRVLSAHERDASARAIAEKIREKFSAKYISAASETVLSLIGRGHEKIAVDLVRAIDKIAPPRKRLQDVWRVKCLFDLIPQARTFIERLYEIMPDRILSVRDNFYNMQNPRNYRDAKVILNISTNPDVVVPMEIICQVRTFFEFENKNSELGFDIPDVSMFGMFKITAENQPDALAYEYFGTKCTYSNLVKKIEDISGAFYSLGVRKGDIVTIIMPNTPSPSATTRAIVTKRL